MNQPPIRPNLLQSGTVIARAAKVAMGLANRTFLVRIAERSVAVPNTET